MNNIQKPNLFILTGAPGSGKSAVLRLLQQRGIFCIEEYARQIIQEQRAIQGDGVYDINPALFKELMLSRAISLFHNAPTNRITVLDRGIPDLLAYAQNFNLPIGSEQKASEQFRYSQTVFFAPSWEGIYVTDDERRMSFDEAKAFGDDLKDAYIQLGYRLIELPCSTVEDRVKLIEQKLNK